VVKLKFCHIWAPTAKIFLATPEKPTITSPWKKILPMQMNSTLLVSDKSWRDTFCTYLLNLRCYTIRRISYYS